MEILNIFDGFNKRYIGNECVGTITSNSYTSTTHAGTYMILQDLEGVKLNKESGRYIQVNPTLTIYAAYYPPKDCYVALRRLTPKECFRLQGWTDDYFERAELVNSDSQLYKQAGNGVTVNVVEAITKKMK